MPPAESALPPEPTEAELAEQRLKKAQELSQKFILADGHVDLPYRLSVARFKLVPVYEDVSKRTPVGNFDFVRAKEGGLDAPFMSIYIPAWYQKDSIPDSAKKYANYLIRLIDSLPMQHPDKFALANSPAEVKANTAKGLLSLPKGMENGAPILNDLSNVAYFKKKGVSYITLTHSKDNQISDSSYDTTHTHNGLSPFGRKVVQEMNRQGIMVDISHVSDSAFWQTLRISKAPVIASHSSLRYYTPGFERNMSDEMVKALGKNNGVILINFGSTFLDKASRERQDEIRDELRAYRREKGLSADDPAYQAYSEQYEQDNFQFATVEIVADHIDRVVELAGIDHVGFGSDFDGVGNSLPDGLKDVSMYPNLIAELLKRGYTEQQIQKISSGNFMRVWQAVLNISADLKASANM